MAESFSETTLIYFKTVISEELDSHLTYLSSLINFYF